MNNEPVAWMYETELQDGTTVKRVAGAWELKYKYIVDACDRENPIPLYTHPVDAVNTSEQYVDKNQNNRHDLGIAEAVGFDKGYAAAQAKTLTDAEINELAENTLPNEAIGFVPSWQWIEFARAILRKAQEK